MGDERDDVDLVAAARAGEDEAFATLVDRWLDRCWNVAWRIVHDRDLAADVAQETLVTAWRQLDRLDQPAAFGGWVLRIARNRALDLLDKERRAVPTGDADALEPRGDVVDLDDPVAAVSRTEQHDLVWAAAAALGERDASILDLHLRHGLEPHELATELGIAPNAAHQALFRLRNRLGDAVRAWMLWHDGEPRCVTLAAELAVAGATAFSPTTARAITRHAGDCSGCADQRDRVTSPAAMFAAVPWLVLPAAARAELVRALGEAGVPVPTTPAGGPHDPDPPVGAGGPPGGPAPPGGSGPRTAWRRVAQVATVALVVAGLLVTGTRWAADPGGDLLGTAPGGEVAVADPVSDRLDGWVGPLEAATRAHRDEVDPGGAQLDDPDQPDTPPMATDPPPTTSDPGRTDPDDTDDAGGADDADDPDEADPDEGTDDPDPDPEAELPRTTTFEVVATSRPCDDLGREVLHVVSWRTERADQARLSSTSGLDEAVALDGDGVEVCALPAREFTLTATNEHGSVATTVVPAT